METPGKEMIQVRVGTERNSVRFHHAQKGVPCKTYGLLIPEVFCLIFLDCG